jgi:methylglutaconyl-CoA hydratase
VSLISVTRSGRVATVALNQPERRNPLSTAMVVDLTEALRECDGDESVGCVVLTGAGASFSAGADLQEFNASLDAGSVEHWSSGEAWAELFRLVPAMAKPVVAKVRGHALAGGCGLVALCDLAVAADTADFGTPEIDIGLFPLFIFPALIRAIGRRNAMALCLSGRRIDAEEAQRMGLVNAIVTEAQLDAFVADLATGLAAKPPHAMQMGKHAFYRMAELDYDAGIDFARAMRGAFLGGDELRQGTERFLRRPH